MFEKVNPKHPDKVADRIAGAIVDLAYAGSTNPKVACEVLIGHGFCNVMLETDFDYSEDDIEKVIYRIAEDDKLKVCISINKQDEHLSKNQEEEVRCGDNGIFKGVPITKEQESLSAIAKSIYEKYPYDGKYIIDCHEDSTKLYICQSNCDSDFSEFEGFDKKVNPLGYWTGGTNVDSGATNRKLGSDMGDSVTGGGLHGKDLSKADVSVNIYAWKLAQTNNDVVTASCAIGDTKIRFYIGDGQKYIDIPYGTIVNTAKYFIGNLGGFEKFAEWGLI